MKILSFLLALLQMFFCGVAYGKKGETLSESKTPVKMLRDIRGDSPLSDTVLYAAEAENTVQAFYETGKRNTYTMQNKEMRLTHQLKGLTHFATLTDADGNAYIRNSFDAFYTQKGKTHYAGVTFKNARVNTIRLGLYYYECHIRDLDFCTNDFMLDKAFHVYADKLYVQYSLYAKKPTTALQAFGSVLRIPVSTVDQLQLRDANGTHSDPAEADSDTIEYAAFDIQNVGIVGLIVPPNGGKMTVEKCGSMYIVRQYAPYKAGTGINQFDETGGYALNYVTFGCRIWTDRTHDFAGVDAASREERTPLTLTVGENDSDAEFIGYNALRGTYDIQIGVTGFVKAYQEPDRQFTAPITVQGGETERAVYLRTFSDRDGCLEAAALLDAERTPVPVNMQVNKNFCGDYGEPEPYYYAAKDYAYSESISPLFLPAGQAVVCTVVQIYQNWGKVPLKQLSSIEFHTSYYHLSTGVTESNCIAPYFVGDKDGWLLPDFRGRSGKIWAEQPQYNSVGVLNFVRYRRANKTVLSEYQGSRIDSVGQTYADITMDYTADCGSYTYTLRHSEMPQTDENRTYYTVDIRFTRDISFRNFRKDFDLFYFDGRSVTFDKMGYLNAENQPTRETVKNGTRFYTLGTDAPYYDFFRVSDDKQSEIDNHFGSSFGLIVRNSQILQDGKEVQIPLCLRTQSKKDLTAGALTLDAAEIGFHAGDRIRLQLVLLPWGTGREETDDNVLVVREDSALQPVRITAKTGTAAADDFLPRVQCENNTAEFTVTGGRNNITVRVDGFTDFHMPALQKKTADGWESVTLSSVNGYDGYTVHYNPDGTYGFSFVFEAQSPESETTFRLG